MLYETTGKVKIEGGKFYRQCKYVGPLYGENGPVEFDYIEWFEDEDETRMYNAPLRGRLTVPESLSSWEVEMLDEAGFAPNILPASVVVARDNDGSVLYRMANRTNQNEYAIYRNGVLHTLLDARAAWLQWNEGVA